MKPRFVPNLQDWPNDFFNGTADTKDTDFFLGLGTISVARDSFAFAPMPNNNTAGSNVSGGTVEHTADFANKFAALSNDTHAGAGQSAFDWLNPDHSTDFGNHLITPNIHYAELAHAYLIH
jgi:hypothetical protein